MNINKKLGRVRQWAGEKMGAEAKTNVSEEFKTLELEMALRHDGMEKLQKSMTVYIKSMAQRTEIEDQKMLPVAYVGQTMINHGEDFETDSDFGNCLIAMGRANERIARTQEVYVSNATSGWLESLERSLVMMKEYQSARKKLENRRLAYDTSLSKMQKAKREDFRVEEELRSQKAKYEESSEDVFRRMQDIKEAEAESVADLGAFLEAELEYHDRCRDELLRLKKDWPVGNITAPPQREQRRPNTRSRSNTARSYNGRINIYEDEPIPELPVRPSIRSRSHGQMTPSSGVDADAYNDDSEVESQRPNYGRATTFSSAFQGPTSISRAPNPRQNSVPADVNAARANLRPPTANRINIGSDVFGDPSDDSTFNSVSPDRSYGERSVSPATSHGSDGGRNATNANGRKGPPPPPPSRMKKPAPPPPPMKRAEISSSNVNR